MRHSVSFPSPYPLPEGEETNLTLGEIYSIALSRWEGDGVRESTAAIVL
jgi:hypothetical protein